MRCTSLSRVNGVPSWSLMAMNAAMSFGKQEPPYPIPAFRKSRPIRWSVPIPLATFSTSAPLASQIADTALMYEIFKARNEFSMFNELGPANVRNEDRRHERLIYLFH